MIAWLGWVIVAAGLVATIYAIVRAVRNLPLDDPLLFGVVGIELLLIVQLVAGLVLIPGTSRDIDTVTFVAYLVGVVVLLPLGTVWALVEKSRYGPAVLALAAFSASVMTLRLLQLWNGGTLV